jgi:hypothetical protein
MRHEQNSATFTGGYLNIRVQFDIQLAVIERPFVDRLTRAISAPQKTSLSMLKMLFLVTRKLLNGKKSKGHFTPKYEADTNSSTEQGRRRRVRDTRCLFKRLIMQLGGRRKILRRYSGNSIFIIFIIRNCKGS